MIRNKKRANWNFILLAKVNFNKKYSYITGKSDEYGEIVPW